MEKAFYKLMKNAVYGKSMENLRNRVNIRLVNNQVIQHKILKTTLTLSKAAYFRICILELSNVSMFEFYYDYMKNKYGNKSRLLFTDTDSLIYKTETENVYDNISKSKKCLILVFIVKSKYYDDSNWWVVGE